MTRCKNIVLCADLLYRAFFRNRRPRSARLNGIDLRRGVVMVAELGTAHRRVFRGRSISKSRRNSNLNWPRM